MSKGFKTNTQPEKSILGLLKTLFESNRISGVVALNKPADNGAVSYSLTASPEGLASSVPFYQLMPSNCGGVVGHLTRECPFDVPIAVVLRPCELRALVELKKRTHANLDNLILISQTCPGVYPIKMMRNGGIEGEIDQYRDAVRENSIPQHIRPTCRGCKEFVPYGADIIVDLVGNENPNSTVIAADTERGMELIGNLDGEPIEVKLNGGRAEELREKRTEAGEILFEENDTECLGLEGIINTFGRCVRCHSCSSVCPICSCDLCYFDSNNTEYGRKSFEAELTRKKGVRLPPDTVLYHLGRMAHMSFSCVGCGQCSDVCPVGIPVSTIFMKVGQAVQETFAYLPGRNMEEKPPVTTYDPEEFAEVGE